ncbi:MAG TPA: AraC family transcriptional regulator [Steroidobacteraceae bacterium]
MTKTASTASIRANVLAGIVQVLRQQGTAVDSLLTKHIGSLDLFADPYEQIPLAAFVGFLEDAAQLAGEAALGAKLGGQSQPEDFGPIGLMFLTAPSLRIAFDHLRTFYSVWQGATRVELDTHCEMPECIYQILEPDIWPRRQDAEFSLAAICTAIRALLGPRWSPVEVHFEHERSPHHTRETESALQRVFRAPVVFGQSVNRLILDPEDLVRPVARRGVALMPYLERHLKDLMRTEDITLDSCTSQVSHVISKRLGRSTIDLQTIAAELGLSARTLQRRLAEEGTSIRNIVRRHRSQVVERLLKDSKAKITVIAHDLGYSDATAFSRAFKNWRGESPRDHRVPRLRR